MQKKNGKLTEGSVGRHLLDMALPVLLGITTMMGQSFIDAYFLGMVGDRALAAHAGAVVELDARRRKSRDRPPLNGIGGKPDPPTQPNRSLPTLEETSKTGLAGSCTIFDHRRTLAPDPDSVTPPDAANRRDDPGGHDLE